MTAIPPRPTLAASSAIEATVPVRNWLASKGLAAVPSKFEECLAAAFLSATDAYAIARNCEVHFKWPADAELVALLAEALTAGKATQALRVKQWVVATGIRFPAQPKQQVAFEDGPQVLTGIVVNVLADTAEAVVVLCTDLAQRSKDTPMRRLKAEEILDMQDHDDAALSDTA